MQVCPAERRALAAVCAVLLAGLCARTAGAQEAEEEAAETRLEAITWIGVEEVPTSELESILLTPTRPRWRFWERAPRFDEALLSADMERIVALYREHGYYEARASYELEWDAAGTRARARITVEEGAPVRLESWSVDLSELARIQGGWRDRLLEDLPLREGRVFTMADYREARRRLLERMAEHGRPDATLSGGGDVDLSTHTARVRWTLHPGPLVRFGEVRVEGLDAVSEELVRRELTIEPGERYAESELRTSQQQVSDLGVFRSVLLTVPQEAQGAPVRPLSLSLEERPPRNVRFGLGYGTTDRVRVQAGWLHRNAFGRADPFELHGRYSALGSELEATLREPRVPDRRTTLELGSRLRNETLPAYDAVELRNAIAVERPLRRGWSGRAAYVLDWTSVDKTPGGAEVELDRPDGRFLLSYLELGVRRITTDNLIDPTRGTWLELGVEPSWRWLGSDVSYARWTFDARGFVPVGPLVIAARGLIGTIDALGTSASADLPVTKLFFAGGSTSVRGYDFQRLGPADAEGNPLGGASLMTGSLELRFPLYAALRGVAFVDAGQIDVEPWTWRPNELSYAAGVGLRYPTPLGPVRVDVGFPLDPPEDVQRVRLWLSIGQAF